MTACRRQYPSLRYRLATSSSEHPPETAGSAPRRPMAKRFWGIGAPGSAYALGTGFAPDTGPISRHRCPIGKVASPKCSDARDKSASVRPRQSCLAPALDVGLRIRWSAQGVSGQCVDPRRVCRAIQEPSALGHRDGRLADSKATLCKEICESASLFAGVDPHLVALHRL